MTARDDEPDLAPSPPRLQQPDLPVEPVPVAPVPPPKKTGRAGRNLPAAVGVGVGLGAVILLALYVERVAFLGVLAVAAVVGVWELANALRAGGIHIPIAPVLVGGVGLLVAAYAAGPSGLVIGLALTVAAVLVWRVIGDPRGRARDVCAGIFVGLYVPFLAGYASLLLRAPDGAQRITLFILVTIASDIGGYAAGVMFGRHPMAPTVSPKKSWEGFAGSTVSCVLVGALAGPPLVGAEWWHGLLLGVAVVCTATLGDLGESLIKRDLNIKDMGSLLPGHGGLMDRLDSLLPTAPVCYLVLVAVVGPV